MSSVAKPSTLRIILPKALAQRAMASLGPLGKVDAQELVLDTGRMTTEDVVRYIKEYAKLRDGMSQTLRQLGIERKPESAIPETSDLKTTSSEAETQAAEARREYQKILSSVEAAERQFQEIEKQVSTVEQLKGTGFSFDEIMSGATGFRRILGRLPSKKLDAAQKALRALLKERAVMTTGAKRNDSVHILVATSTEDASQALQTLLLYDFVPTDIPNIEAAVALLDGKSQRLLRNGGDKVSGPVIVEVQTPCRHRFLATGGRIDQAETSRGTVLFPFSSP